jgi:DNA-binding Lrp family transcriptional regulator
MREAFVCINASPGSVEEVFKEVKECREVQEAFRVHGVYDIIARVSGETFEELIHVVNERIKRLGEVQTILSMLLIESEKPVGDGKLLLV